MKLLSTVCGLLIAFGPKQTALAMPADEIKVEQARPMMGLAGELRQRYGYLVTYEDAPVSVREMITENRPNGLEYRYPAWKPMTFHPTARRAAAPPQTVGPDVMEPLIQEYASSGNPGRFKVIYDGAYTHIVPAALLRDGLAIDFDPILSTKVLVKKQEGSCWELLNSLVDEVQELRKVKIMVFFAPVSPGDPDRCLIHSHDLAAREILIQLLTQMGEHPGFATMPKEYFTWTLVYEPTSETYFLATQHVPTEEELNGRPPKPPAKSVPPTPAQGQTGTSWADGIQISEIFRSILSHSSEGNLPKQDELFLKVNEETVGALSVAALNAILRLAKQCLQASRLEVRQDGLLLFMAVGLRPDSANLLESYIDDLGSLLGGPKEAQSLRHGALYILGSTNPGILPRAAEYLAANLENDANTREESLTIAASLLSYAPSDAAIVHKVLAYVTRRKDSNLTSGTVRQIGLLKGRTPEAMSFVGTCLDDRDPAIREAAVDAASRLERDLRATFSKRLLQMAVDKDETPEIRSAADAALRK